MDLLHEYYDALPQATVVLRDGALVYRSPRAAQLLPALDTQSVSAVFGRDVPTLSGSEFVASFRADGQFFSGFGSPITEGTVVALTRREGGNLVNHAVASDLLDAAMAVSHCSESVLASMTPEQRAQPQSLRLRRSACRVVRLGSNAAAAAYEGVADRPDGPSAYDLAMLCRVCADGVAELTGERGVSVSFDCGETSFLPVCGNPEDTRRVLLNLLSNAVKFTPRGGEVTLALRADEYGATVTVTDTGRGMTGDQLFTLWAPDRAGIVTPLTDAAAGAGLGLRAAQLLCARQGGTTAVRSRPQGGLEVRLWLPLPRGDGGDLRQIPDYLLAGYHPLLTELSDIADESWYGDEYWE